MPQKRMFVIGFVGGRNIAKNGVRILGILFNLVKKVMLTL
jgi:hypothetical protein